MYVKIAPRCKKFDENRAPLEMRFSKSLYGLRQRSTGSGKTRSTNIGWKLAYSHKSQVGPVRVHLVGEQRYCNSDYMRRKRRSPARNRPPGAEADLADADESFLDDGHGKRVTRARDWRNS